MADSPSYPDANRGARMRPTRGPIAGLPRWVKVFLIVFLALVVLFMILHLTGNGFGDHMHMSTFEYGVGQQ